MLMNADDDDADDYHYHYHYHDDEKNDHRRPTGRQPEASSGGRLYGEQNQGPLQSFGQGGHRQVSREERLFVNRQRFGIGRQVVGSLELMSTGRVPVVELLVVMMLVMLVIMVVSRGVTDKNRGGGGAEAARGRAHARRRSLPRLLLLTPLPDPRGSSPQIHRPVLHYSFRACQLGRLVHVFHPRPGPSSGRELRRTTIMK